MSNKDSFDYELKSQITYHHKGNVETAQMVRFMSPTSKTLKLCSDLKQQFFRAMPQADPNNKDEIPKDADEVELDGDSVMMMISTSKEVSLADVLITAQKLFMNKEVALLDGEERITQSISEQISNDELEEMTGQYMANFILASALEKMNKRLSRA